MLYTNTLCYTLHIIKETRAGVQWAHTLSSTNKIYPFLSLEGMNRHHCEQFTCTCFLLLPVFQFMPSFSSMCGGGGAILLDESPACRLPVSVIVTVSPPFNENCLRFFILLNSPDLQNRRLCLILSILGGFSSHEWDQDPCKQHIRWVKHTVSCNWFGPIHHFTLEGGGVSLWCL